MKLTQEGLCRRTGITLSSYRRFERTGQISLDSLSRIAIMMNNIEEINNLFSRPHYNNIDEVINASQGKTRKRGIQNE